MVGFDPANDPGLSRIQYAIAGATSGVITRALIQPIDVVKIRFQVCSRCTKKTKEILCHLCQKSMWGLKFLCNKCRKIL